MGYFLRLLFRAEASIKAFMPMDLSSSYLPVEFYFGPLFKKANNDHH
jgi:hypothetical protein